MYYLLHKVGYGSTYSSSSAASKASSLPRLTTISRRKAKLIVPIRTCIVMPDYPSPIVAFDLQSFASPKRRHQCLGFDTFVSKFEYNAYRHQLIYYHRTMSEAARSSDLEQLASKKKQLSSARQTSGEVSRRPTTVLPKPPPIFVPPRSSHDSNSNRGLSSAYSKIFKQSNTCRSCKHDNSSNDTRYHSSYSSYSRSSSSYHCTNCHSMM